MSADDILVDDFVVESGELLEGLDVALSEVLHTNSTDPLHGVFRAVHTVKGTAGFLGFLNVKNFAHTVEDVLDRLRSDQLTLDEGIRRELVACIDLLAIQVPRVAQLPPGNELTDEETQALERLREAVGLATSAGGVEFETLQRIDRLLKDSGEAAPEQSVERIRQLLAVWSEAAASTDADDADWLTSAQQGEFAVGADAITDLVRPTLAFFEAARGESLTDAIVDKYLEDMTALLAKLDSTGEKQAAPLLEKVVEECRVIHESPIELDDLLVSTLADPTAEALALLKAAPKAKQTATGPDDAEPPAAAATREPTAARAGGATLRVQEEVLDKFIWHVGETFLAAELYRDLQNRLADAKLAPAFLTEFNQLNRELTVSVGKLQQTAMDVRRVSVGALLNKIPAMARQLSAQLEKQVEVEVLGAEERVDKSLVQCLEGPMTHLIRNALDHGLQPPEERSRLGLNPCGRLVVACRLERDSVVVTIEDDGRGIDPDAIRRKAIEKGVIDQTQAALLDHESTLMLLCRPGFSTAEKISDVSGRGVGLDVVLSAVERERGKLRIGSELGRGTKFTLAFPLKSTVIMVDGLLCETQGRFVAFETDYVNEVVALEPGMLSSVGGAPVATIRDRTYPIVPLARILDVPDADSTSNGASARNGVVLEYQHNSLVVTVDRLAGYRKMVLKDFDRSLITCDFVDAVAQLSGTKLALMLDVPGLLRSLS